MAETSGNRTGEQESFIAQLLQHAREPPEEVVGVSQDFMDNLERVPKKQLKKTEECPICAQPFLDGELDPA